MPIDTERQTGGLRHRAARRGYEKAARRDGGGPAPRDSVTDRALLRLLRAVAGGRGSVGPAGEVIIAVEAGGLHRTARLPIETLASAETAGLVRRDGAVLALTAEGVAHLARATASESPFLAQHRPLARREIEVDGQVSEVLVDEAESPLAWLRRRRGRDGAALIGDAAFCAGERLRADFTRGSMSPRMTADWEASGASGRQGGGSLGYSDLVVAARQRVQAALGAVGPELSGVVMDVCCFLKGLEEVERDREWPVRSAKVVLSLGLARLARHYGLETEARGPAHGRMRQWGADDYRPTIGRA